MYTCTTAHRASLLLLILSVLLIVSAQAAAQPGTLDPTFGTGGIVTTDFGNQNNGAATANAVAIQTDGKIVVCGGVPGSSNFAVAGIVRYNMDGSLDTSFGNAGIAVTPNLAPFTSIALQTNGEIVAAVTEQLKIQVARYSSNGSLDTTFGAGGIFTSKFPLFGASGPTKVVIQPDDKILVAEGVMLRLLSDGQLDTSFGTGGEATSVGDNTVSLVLLPNGKILVGLALANDFASGGFVTRYNSNGSLDASFGINGQLASAGPANGLVLFSTGEFVAGGSLTSSPSEPTTGFAVSRYQAVGVTDAKFGTHGGVVTSVPGYTTVATSGLGVQSTGDIVTLGTASTTVFGGPLPVFALARYTPSGQLDHTFGTNGIVTTSFGSDGVAANGLAIQSDGKIVAVGSYRNGFDTGFKLARYLGQ